MFIDQMYFNIKYIHFIIPLDYFAQFHNTHLTSFALVQGITSGKEGRKVANDWSKETKLHQVRQNAAKHSGFYLAMLFVSRQLTVSYYCYLFSYFFFAQLTWF